MAVFVKCKQEFVKYKTHVKKQTGTYETTFLWTKKVKPIYTEVPDKEEKSYNNIVNLNLVLTIEKALDVPDRDSDGYRIENTYRPAIKFDFGRYSETWCYDDEKTRDEQYEEVASNIHSQMAKITI